MVLKLLICIHRWLEHISLLGLLGCNDVAEKHRGLFTTAGLRFSASVDSINF